MEWSLLPHLNAALNLTTAVLLIGGLLAIRSGRQRLHHRFMVSAFGVAVLFLVSYLIYHFRVGTTRFPGEGLTRSIYLSILGSHTVLAAAVPVLAIVTLTLALRGSFGRHRRWARWTLPIWLYVSVTGVVVYWMLYRVAW